MSSGDYTNYTAGGASCSYGSLGEYNAGYSMDVPPQGKITSGAYIVPTWDPISYDSLSNPFGSCSGYATINNAYGQGSGKCQTTYRTSLCGGQRYGSSCASLSPQGPRQECCKKNPDSDGCPAPPLPPSNSRARW